jgi:hypothetical protein
MKNFILFFSIIILCSFNLFSIERILIGQGFDFYKMAKNDKDELYVTGVTKENHVMTNTYHTYVIKSTDYGDTWDYVLKKDFVFMEQSFEDRYSFQHIFIQGNDSIFVLCDGGIIYRSYDAGVSWDSSRITYEYNGKKYNISNRSICKDAKNYKYQLIGAFFPDEDKEILHTVYTTDFGNTWKYFERTDEPERPEVEKGLFLWRLEIPNDSLIYYIHHTSSANIHFNVYNIKSKETKYISTLPRPHQYFQKFLNDSTILFYGFYFGENLEIVFPTAYISTDRGKTFHSYYDSNEEVNGEFQQYITGEANEYFLGYDTFMYREKGGGKWNQLPIDCGHLRDVEILGDEILFAAELQNYIIKIDKFTSVEESNYVFKNPNQIAKSSLFLNFNKKDNYSYQIYDLRGKEMHSGSILVNSDFLTFDVSYLQNGTYIIMFKDSKGKISDNVVFIKE